MKKFLLVLLILLPLLGCGESFTHFEDIALDDPKTLEKIIAEAIEGDESTIESYYTGWAKEISSSGRVRALKLFKKGKVTGCRQWYSNGQKKSEVIVDDGKFMSAIVWKPNGDKCSKTNLKDGNGIIFGYLDDGGEFGFTTFKDGELVLD